jgi:hypothetical protein
MRKNGKKSMPRDHNPKVCWQYKIKWETLNEDLAGDPEIPTSTKDLEFSYVDKGDKESCREIVAFIERYEWLGIMPIWVTHRFTARYKGTLIAANIFGTPYAFSNLLGKDNNNLEKHITRGASISYAPKNTASWLIMQSIRWMVKNTEFRLFTAYADPSAGELGTIYQACNFFYLGQDYGTKKAYVHNETGRQYGASYFNNRSVIKRAALASGLTWISDYIVPNKSGSKRVVKFSLMKPHEEVQVRNAVEKYKENFTQVDLPPKHKYAYVLGRTKLETRRLRTLYLNLNEIKPYPTERGKYGN